MTCAITSAAVYARVERVRTSGEQFTTGGARTIEGPAPIRIAGLGDTERLAGLKENPSVLLPTPCSVCAAATGLTFSTSRLPTERLITTGVGV